MKKILIIDDEASVREAIVQSLRMHAFETLEADNGRAGVRLAQEHLPDLILSDIRMESFDGFAALAAIRYQPITATIPFILMTGDPDESGRRLGMELGADDYLAKPFSMTSLLAVVHVQLKKRGAIRQQALNLKPSEADRAEVSTVAEAETPPDNRPANLDAEFGDQALPKPRDVPEELPRTSLLGMAAATTPENASLALEVSLRMLNTYHPNLGGVARRAAALCEVLGQVLKPSFIELAHLVRAAALCDIALVGINHFVVGRWLRDPQNLQKHEWVLIRDHPEQAQRLLEAWPVFQGAGQIIRSHHENWDGTGYPDGLAGERIPWPARLLAAAHYYCSRYDPTDRVLEELALHAGTLFDPKAIEAVAHAARLAKLPGGEREILLTELRGGHVLARDLHNANGVVLLPKGRLITEPTIARLLVINRTRPLDQRALVYS